MASELDTILITQERPGFEQKLRAPLGKISSVSFLCSRVSIELRAQVTEIIDNVQQQGDNAIVEYTKKFDGKQLAPSEFLVPPDELKLSHGQIDADVLGSIRGAIENVR